MPFNLLLAAVRFKDSHKNSLLTKTKLLAFSLGGILTKYISHDKSRSKQLVSNIFSILSGLYAIHDE